MSQSSSDGSNDPPGLEGVPADDRHRVLAAEHRRVLLDVLAERELPAHVEELAADVADSEGEPADAGSVNSIAIALHHTHLPVMADCGIVEYDTRSNWVVSFRDS